MWSYQYATKTDAQPEQIWSVLRDQHTGAYEDPSGDRFEIHGPFAVGTELSVTPQGQDTFSSVITELKENEVYEDETRLDGFSLRFRHTLLPTDSGGALVTHGLVIDGPAADAVGPELGPQITADFPAALDSLVSAAASR
jgi:hypothetical protein